MKRIFIHWIIHQGLWIANNNSHIFLPILSYVTSQHQSTKVLQYQIWGIIYDIFSTTNAVEFVSVVVVVVVVVVEFVIYEQKWRIYYHYYHHVYCYW